MTPLQDQKQQLRREIQARLHALSSSEKLSQSESICQQLQEKLIRDWYHVHTFAVFASLIDEPDIWAFTESLWQQQKRVVFPADHNEQNFAFVEVSSRTELVKKHGFWQPSSDSQVIELAEIEVFIVPGIAFTSAGQRLGRGGGWYDRVLQQRSSTSLAVGVSFAEQIVEELPAAEFDQQVDEVISELLLEFEN